MLHSGNISAFVEFVQIPPKLFVVANFLDHNIFYYRTNTHYG